MLAIASYIELYKVKNNTAKKFILYEEMKISKKNLVNIMLNNLLYDDGQLTATIHQTNEKNSKYLQDFELKNNGNCCFIFETFRHQGVLRNIFKSPCRHRNQQFLCYLNSPIY